jgi:hypothetical protein
MRPPASTSRPGPIDVEGHSESFRERNCARQLEKRIHVHDKVYEDELRPSQPVEGLPHRDRRRHHLRECSLLRMRWYPLGIGSLVLLGVVSMTGCDTAGQSSPRTDINTEAYLQSNSRALATQLGITNPPDVALIRLVTLDDWDEIQRACLQDEGFDVEETVDGQGVHYPPIEDLALAASLNLSIYTCEVKYPLDQKYTVPLTDGQLRDLYEYRSQGLVSCLDKEGYEVFVQTGGSWSPYEDISVPDEDLKRIFESCPQALMSIYD